MTDTAIQRFLRHDGRVVQDLLKELLLKARMQDISKVNGEAGTRQFGNCQIRHRLKKQTHLLNSAPVKFGT